MRAILHLRIPAFAVAVEQVVQPRLAGRPVAVAPPTARAPVLEVSAEARAAGVRRGIPAAQAVRLCRDLIVLDPHPELYARANAALERVLNRFSPLVEPHRGGRIWLDATGTTRLFGVPRDLALRISRDVPREVRLVPRLGLSINKLCSGVAARLVPPREPCLEVPEGGESGFLAPHPLWLLPGVDGPLRRTLAELGLLTIGQVAAVPATELTVVLGPTGKTLSEQARGIDPTPVTPPHRGHQIRMVQTLPEDTENPRVLDAALGKAVARLGWELRTSRRTAARVRLSLRYADGRGGAGWSRLPAPTNLDLTLHRTARAILDRVFTRRVRVRSIGLIVEGLTETPRQPGLFDDEPSAGPGGGLPPHEAALIEALDRLRRRFGPSAVRFGRVSTEESGNVPSGAKP